MFHPKVMAPVGRCAGAFKNLSTRRRNKPLESWGAVGNQAWRAKTSGAAGAEVRAPAVDAGKAATFVSTHPEGDR